MNDTLLWYTTRGAGAVSLVLLSIVTALGLLARRRIESRRWPRFLTAALHRDLSLLAVVFLALHIVTAVVDPFTGLGITPVVVPFGSYYRTFWLGLGTVAFELMLAVIATSLLRHLIGARVWRGIHWLAYAMWPIAVLHGVGTGTDAFSTWLLAVTGARGFSILAGPAAGGGMEHVQEHIRRLGPAPRSGAGLIDVLDRSGLEGRGGAAFPVGTKWRTVAARSVGRAAVLVNGAEGEPLSHKDRVLMELRPHLVIDGAVLAAAAVDAAEVVLYVGAEHARALRSMRAALAERPASERDRMRIVLAPGRYVAGEESAAVRCVDTGVALPASVPPRPFERGIGGMPTLVQNVESLAHAALIARFGDAWFRSIGGDSAPGSVLLTVRGAVRDGGVLEVPQGTTVGDAVDLCGGLSSRSFAVLLGGYFGSWVPAAQMWDLPLDAASLRAQGRSLGCGVVAVLPEERCGVVETARLAGYLAAQSARQCGPCVFGLRAIADALGRIATGRAHPDDLERVRAWSGELPGRGACRHPDGAAALVLSALRTFSDEFAIHHRQQRCGAGSALVAA